MKTTIEVNIGSDVAHKYSHTMKEYLPPSRAALFDTLADILAAELEDSYPFADVTVSCKPGVEKLQGEATDVIICASGDVLSDDAIDTMHMVVTDIIDGEAMNFFEREDVLEDLVGEYEDGWRDVA